MNIYETIKALVQYAENEKLIEKVYKIIDEKEENKFEELLSSIPPEHIRIANNIVEYVRNEMEIKINDSIYLSLTDHINYAIERAKNGVCLKNALLIQHRLWMP